MNAAPGLDGSAQTEAEVNARLAQDFRGLEPVLHGPQIHRSGEVRVAVGTLALTHSVTRQDEALPDECRYSQTAAVYQSDTLRFPRFDLQPTNAARGLLETAARSVLRIGDLGKVDFPSHAGFASRYRVQAFDAEHTHWLFEDRLLTQLAGRTGLSISASNGTLLLYRARTEIPRESWQAFASEAFEVFRLFEAAARRPGAFSDPMRPRPTDYEFFTRQLSATGLGFKELPRVTLAEAEAFIGQPPPRAFSPGVARFCKEQVSPLVIHFGGVFAAGSAFFLLVGQGSVPWYGQVALCLLFVAGIAMAVTALAIRLRMRHLLRHGRTGIARIESIQTFDSKIDGSTLHRLELEIEAGGSLHRASCLVPSPALDRLKAIAAQKRPVPVLYSAANPKRALVADALVMAPDIG